MAPKKVVKVVSPEDVTPALPPVKDVLPLPETTSSTDVDTVPATTPQEEEVVVVTKDKFAEVLEVLQGFQNSLKEIIATVKVLQREHVKLQKQKVKKNTRRQSVSVDGAPKRQPSGFAKPTKLSIRLCDFLGVPHDSLMARTEVTKLLNEYIKANNLEDENDRRNINPDAKMLTILDNVVAPLSFFSLQSAIKSHFEKV